MGLRLLIADDEEAVRSGMYRYLKIHTGRYERIDTASDGTEALEQVKALRPDVMLLDIQLPVKNGIELVNEMKELEILPVTLILSGQAELRYAEQAVACGARSYMLTPVRAQELLRELLEIADELEGREDVPTGMRLVEEYIQAHFREDISLSDVARVAGISAGYFSTLFSQTYGCGFAEYLNRLRVQHACTLLKHHYLKMYEVAFGAGFRDEKYFSRVFRKTMGMTPSEYRRKHKK